MRHLTPCLLAAASIFAFACNPRLPIHLESPRHPPLPDTAICVILGLQDPIPDSKNPILRANSPIGQIAYRQTATSNPWSNDRIIQYFRTTALKNGANLVIVTQYIGASRRSMGVVAASLYRVPDIRNYERLIDLSASRRLELVDFKGSPPAADSSTPAGERSVRQSRSDFGIYCFFRPGGLFGKTECHSRASFRCHSSWIDARTGDTAKLLIHEQGSFDLWELYCRQLEQQLLHHKPHRFISARVLQAIYGQIYAAFLATRDKYDEDTKYGLDTARQTLWTHQIAADSSFTVRLLLKKKEQDSAARVATPARDQSLVYIIRPDLFTTVPSSAMANDTHSCHMGLFGNMGYYRIYDGHSVSQPIGAAKFSYMFLTPGSLTAWSGMFTGCRTPEQLQLSLVAGKTYYVKLSIFKPSHAVAAYPELTLMTEEEGKKELAGCRLGNYPLF
jgi:hypothetical protein